MAQRIKFQNKQWFFANKNIAAVSLFFTFLLFLQLSLFSQTKSDVMSKPIQDSSNDITIHQEVNFTINPQQLYRALLNSKEFSAGTKKSFTDFSGRSATIDPTVGGTFSLFDGHIIGRILELVPNKRIVQAWRVVDWPDGIYSIARFEFSPQGSGTHLIFNHIGFPKGLKEHLANGWQEHYWNALNNYFH